MACDVWTAGDTKGWTRLAEEDLRALHPFDRRTSIGRSYIVPRDGEAIELTLRKPHWTELEGRWRSRWDTLSTPR